MKVQERAPSTLGSSKSPKTFPKHNGWKSSPVLLPSILAQISSLRSSHHQGTVSSPRVPSFKWQWLTYQQFGLHAPRSPPNSKGGKDAILCCYMAAMGQGHSPAVALPPVPALPGVFFTRVWEKHFCGCLFMYLTGESKKGSTPNRGSPHNVSLFRRNGLAHITAGSLHSCAFGHWVVNVF